MLHVYLHTHFYKTQYCYDGLIGSMLYLIPVDDYCCGLYLYTNQHIIAYFLIIILLFTLKFKP